MGYDLRYDRVEQVMNCIHQYPKLRTMTEVAKLLNLPYSSVRQTIMVDFPDCFETSTRFISLTGEWPDDTPFELEPLSEPEPKPRMTDRELLELALTQTPQATTNPKSQAPKERKWNGEYFEQGLANAGIKKNMTVMEIMGRITSSTEKDWELINMLKALQIWAEIKHAANPKAALSEKITDITGPAAQTITK